MADLDLERGEQLLRSARTLLAQGDLAGVAGLAYQAFESALIALTRAMDGANAGSHGARRERAKTLLAEHRGKIDLLWEVRNVDFYGNPRLGAPRRKLTRGEVEEALGTIEDIFTAINKMLATEEAVNR